MERRNGSFESSAMLSSFGDKFFARRTFKRFLDLLGSFHEVFMVKPAKLYQQLLASRAGAISFRDFVRLLEAFGFVHVEPLAVTASMCIPGARSLPVQPVGKDAKKLSGPRVA
ncbi:hypothetical protein [Blastomonas aquatica]|uniref:hypothetical protein n=1 Tax=Blastomonas aquatica TaxID=1510276 RepID=UPI0036184923